MASKLGARILTIREAMAMGTEKIVDTIRQTMGTRAVYVSFDIDSVDPAYAPGTGTPEVGGFTSFQALEMERGLAGLNLVGFDLKGGQERAIVDQSWFSIVDVAWQEDMTG